MEETFGAYIKRLRLQQKLSLREFCLRIKVDASNYSKLERDLLNPPEEGRLPIYEDALGLEPDGTEARELRRLSALGRGMVPSRVLSDRELAGKLPLFFRTLEGEPLNEEKLDEVIGLIRKAWIHDHKSAV